MQVGVIGPVGWDSFAENIAEALGRLGHTARILGPAHAQYPGLRTTRAVALARTAVPSLDLRFQQRIARAAIDIGCEVIINVDARLMPDVVKSLKRAGARVAFWFPDHVANLGRQLMLLAPYDMLFFKEPQLVDRLRAVLGLPVSYLPEACNPRSHRPLTVAGTEPYLVVLGSMYPYRVQLIERLIAKGIPLKLYGPGFPRWMGETPAQRQHAGRGVFHEEKAKVYRSAAGVLNTMYPAEIMGANGRLFQAAGSGGAVLTEYRPAVADLFSLGQEVLAYHDFDDLIDQATRLLNEAGLTARLGDAATRRAHRDHTYDRRVSTILEYIS
jgi:spore maturation protein CgeB